MIIKRGAGPLGKGSQVVIKRDKLRRRYIERGGRRQCYLVWKRELILPIQICGTCPKPFTHGKIAWASNMNPKVLNFHIFVELSSIFIKGVHLNIKECIGVDG